MGAVTKAVSLAATVVLLAGCPDRESSGDTDRLVEDASFGRRVFRPPPSDPVRAVPPHNIHRTGVGPYELSASLQTTLALLPNGPRVELFEAEGLFDYRLMRSDGDALLLGVGRRGGVAFISVLDPDIARTENGIGVGAGVQELIGALGALRAPKNTGRDPRIITFTALPDTRFIVEKGRVAAAVIMPPSEGEGEVAPKSPPEAGVPGASLCKAGDLEERRADFIELVKQAKFAEGEDGAIAVQFACPASDRGGALLHRGDAVAWAVADPASGELRVIASARIPGLSFVTTLDTGGARPEIYAVSKRRSLQLREVVVTRLALAGGRLTPNWNQVAFSLGARTASWIGARMQTADFLVEMTGHHGAVSVGGIYLERSSGALRHVVPVTRVELPVSQGARRAQDEPLAVDGESAVAPKRDTHTNPSKP